VMGMSVLGRQRLIALGYPRQILLVITVGGIHRNPSAVTDTANGLLCQLVHGQSSALACQWIE
jgi:hypothetical protein